MISVEAAQGHLVAASHHGSTEALCGETALSPLPLDRPCGISDFYPPQLSVCSIRTRRNWKALKCHSTHGSIRLPHTAPGTN